MTYRTHIQELHRRFRVNGGRLAASASIALLLAGCDLGVSNPGRIDDTALNNERAMQPLVTGMAGDFATVYDEVSYFMGIASGDIRHTGAFEEEEFMQRGEITPRHVNGLWGGMQRARWVAEDGIERMQEVLGGDFTASPLATEAYVWAGFSNRVLGENACSAIIDGEPPEEHTVHFERAEQWFAEAIGLAEQQEEEQLRQAAHAGRAQVRLALGDWEGARSDAGEVSSDFSFNAEYDGADDREWNWLHNQSHRRDYFSTFETLADTLDNADPRMPMTRFDRNGTDGVTPFHRQDKYLSLGAEIELAGGDEMRLIEAEFHLRDAGDVPEAMAKINAVRAAAGVSTKTASGEDEAWQALRRERNIVLWMEGRRLWDLRRFDDPFLDGRDSCIPPSEEEQATNPNL